MVDSSYLSISGLYYSFYLLLIVFRGHLCIFKGFSGSVLNKITIGDWTFITYPDVLPYRRSGTNIGMPLFLFQARIVLCIMTLGFLQGRSLYAQQGSQRLCMLYFM